MTDLSFLDEFEEQKGARCSISLLPLSASDSERLDAALSSHYTTAAIERWLTELGCKPGVGALARHRRGGCSCGG